MEQGAREGCWGRRARRLRQGLISLWGHWQSSQGGAQGLGGSLWSGTGGSSAGPVEVITAARPGWQGLPGAGARRACALENRPGVGERQADPMLLCVSAPFSETGAGPGRVGVPWDPLG